MRRAILDGLLSKPERIKLLLDAIEAGQIKATELEPPQVKRLVEHRDAEIKERAAKLLAARLPADRAQALADYQPVLTMAGDAKRGQAIFEKNCSACHRIAGIGVNVAPDISDSRTKKLDQLLGDILQPNRAIDNNYLGYTVRLLDGTIATGILTTETATSITLKQQGGKEAVIARSDIDELQLQRPIADARRAGADNPASRHGRPLSASSKTGATSTAARRSLRGSNRQN